MYKMISIDLGKNLSIAFWKDSICEKVITLIWDDSILHSENMISFMRTIEEIVVEYSPIVVVEKIGRENIGMGLQYIQYMDVREIANRNKCELFSYSNGTIKKAITGNGRADKKEMRENLENSLLSHYFIVKPKNEHEVDAVSVGLTHILKGG